MTEQASTPLGLAEEQCNCGLLKYGSGDHHALCAFKSPAVERQIAENANCSGEHIDMPTIWDDPAGKGYPCFERPMTPRECREALDLYAARIIELEAELAKSASVTDGVARNAIARIRERMERDTRGMTHDGSDQGTAQWWVRTRYDDLSALLALFAEEGREQGDGKPERDGAYQAQSR